ncbi:hypothetical protein Asp14428_29160 [Actinoplanes sp. NBRC 14428]|uniref:Glycosyltransferase RgtA/B/C/D-like domain-containing protein n=1 Tax=Pseudosporangium ferrugineum TaxID=439699 RepID=A0A2T0RRQ3_9ACTN|nr:hypothetical protein [Pseudosporangium ferrugineum]PRY23879.1 hypothetical protein CLV70_1149 [Pseudosporangium ferrugineum]BCJ51441.1 hypothetical protein Asp14428_29160 [Actinoplanes sp. NBRC 14428]
MIETSEAVERAVDAGRPSSWAPVSRAALWVFAGLAILGIVTVLPTVNSWSDASRMATIQSLVDFHTLSIDQSVFHRTGDKVFIDGHFYSDKLAVPSLIGAAVYYPLSAFGVKLGYGWNLAYYVITLLTVKVLWLIGLIAFYRSLTVTPLSDRMRIWLTLALGVGSLYFTWSATFNNHSLAASWVAIGFYFVLRARHGLRKGRSLFAAGLFFALAGGSDVPILAVFGGFFLYVLADKRLRSHAAWYLLPLPLTAIPALLVNYRISGSLVPVQLVTSYFQYPGTPWKPQALTGAGMNQGAFLAEYTYHALIGRRGFLLYNPLLFLALPLLVRELGGSRPFHREARVVCAVTVPIVAYYLLYSNNYSGWSYSIRWFVPLLPLLFFFLYPILASKFVTLKVLFFTVFAAGAAIAVIGLINPWSFMRLSPYPIVANLRTIPEFLEDARHALLGRQ